MPEANHSAYQSPAIGLHPHSTPRSFKAHLGGKTWQAQPGADDTRGEHLATASRSTQTMTAGLKSPEAHVAGLQCRRQEEGGCISARAAAASGSHQATAIQSWCATLELRRPVMPPGTTAAQRAVPATCKTASRHSWPHRRGQRISICCMSDRRQLQRR